MGFPGSLLFWKCFVKPFRERFALLHVRIVERLFSVRGVIEAIQFRMELGRAHIVLLLADDAVEVHSSSVGIFRISSPKFLNNERCDSTLTLSGILFSPQRTRLP